MVSGSPGAVMPNCRHGGGPRGGGRDQGDLLAGHATDGETDAGRCGLPGGVGHEPGIGIAGRMVRVVGEGRSGTAYDERISDHAPAGKTFTGRGRARSASALPRRTPVIAAHAAWRSDAAR